MHTRSDDLSSNHTRPHDNTGPAPERSLKYKRYWREIEEVCCILDRVPEHEAVRAAIAWIARWMELAVHAPKSNENGYVNKIPARTLVRRLAAAQADPRTCLEHVAGCWCYMARNPKKYDSRRAYVLGLGGAFLQVKPVSASEQKLKPTTRSKTEAGEHIFRALQPLLVRINALCLRHKHDHQGLRDAQLAPWDDSTSAVRKCLQRLTRKQRGEVLQKITAQRIPARELR